MTILPIQGPRAAPDQTGRKSSVSTKFFVPAEQRPAPMAAASRLSSTSVEQLLLLQSDGVDPDQARNRRARAEADSLLVELRALQARLLAGGPAAGQLERIAQMARDLPSAADPALNDVLMAVAQRAAVELAHLEVAGRVEEKI